MNYLTTLARRAALPPASRAPGAIVRRSLPKEMPSESGRPRPRGEASPKVRVEVARKARVGEEQSHQQGSLPGEKSRLLSETLRGETNATPAIRPSSYQPAMAELEVPHRAALILKPIADLPKLPGVVGPPQEMRLERARLPLPELTPPAEEGFTPSPAARERAEDGERDASGLVSRREPVVSPERPLRLSLKVESTDSARLPTAKPVRTSPELLPLPENSARKEKPQAVEESLRRATLFPQVVPSTARISEARSEQRVTVHIGAIEIRTLPPERRATEQGARLTPPPPSPAGFDGFARLRSYAPWLP